MFKLFKKESCSTCNDWLPGLTNNQKKSCTNLLFFLARSDGSFTKQEIRFLNEFHFDVPLNDCMDYINTYGIDKAYQDVQSMDSTQKEMLIGVAYDLMICDSRQPNEEEALFFIDFTERLGYDENTVFSVLQKYILFKQTFNIK